MVLMISSGHKKITVTYNKNDDSVQGIWSLSAQYETTIYNWVSRNIDFKIPTCTPKDCYGDCKFYDVSWKSYVPGNSYWFSEDITLTAKADKIEGCSIPQCGEDRWLCAEWTPSNPNPDINFLPPKHEQNNNGWTHRSQWICEWGSEATNSEVTCTQYYSDVVGVCPSTYERDPELGKCIAKAKVCARAKSNMEYGEISKDRWVGNGICFWNDYSMGIDVPMGYLFIGTYSRMDTNGTFGWNVKMEILPITDICSNIQYVSRASEMLYDYNNFNKNWCRLEPYKPQDDWYYLTCSNINYTTDICQMLGRSSKVIQNP